MIRALLAAAVLLTGASLASAYPVTDDSGFKDSIRHGAQITPHGVFDGQ